MNDVEETSDSVKLSVVIDVMADGTFGIHIPAGIQPITLAGIAWFVEQSAQMMLAEIMGRQAEQNARSGIVVADRLPPRAIRRHRN